MKNNTKCICGKAATRHGICDECKELLKVCKCKSLVMLERIRNDYNNKHNTYKTYGQFVAYVDAISRRKKEFDNTRKKAFAKAVRTN